MAAALLAAIAGAGILSQFASSSPTPIGTLPGGTQVVGKGGRGPIVRSTDPHQPLLDETMGQPIQLANKTYAGKTELPKPPRLGEGPEPNLVQTLINGPIEDQHFPYYSRANAMKWAHILFSESARGYRHLTWKKVQADTDSVKVQFRSGKRDGLSYLKNVKPPRNDDRKGNGIARPIQLFSDIEVHGVKRRRLDQPITSS